MKFSIIVPIYNTEEYLSRCLDSVIGQNFSDMELILVNDGSRDNSLEICKKYADQYNFIHIIDKENGGVSSARNVGMESAQGDYIYFLDSDDVLCENVLNIVAENLGTDCIFSTYNKIFDYSKKQFFEEKCLLIDNSFTLKDTQNYIKLKHGSVCYAFYKIDIIKNNLFDSNIKNGEDDKWMSEIIDKMQSFEFMDFPFFCYYINRKHSTTSSYNIDSLYTGLLCYKELLEKSDNEKLRSRYTQSFWNIARKVYRCDNYKNSEAHKLIKEMKYSLKYTDFKVDKLQKTLGHISGLDFSIILTNFLIRKFHK